MSTVKLASLWPAASASALLLVVLAPAPTLAVESDAFAWIDELNDATGIAASKDVTVYSGYLQADADGAEITTDCISRR